MTQGIQEKLADVENALEGMCAIYDCDGDYPHADGEIAREKANKALTLLTELQEELQPKAVGVERIASVIGGYNNREYYIEVAKKVIAEIERQRNER